MIKSKPWTEADDQFLRDNYGKVKAFSIATSLGRTELATRKRANRLRLKGLKFSRS